MLSYANYYFFDNSFTKPFSTVVFSGFSQNSLSIPCIETEFQSSRLFPGKTLRAKKNITGIFNKFLIILFTLI